MGINLRDMAPLLQLKAHGFSLAPPKTAPYGMRQLYVRDPDGYVLCFQWPATNEEVLSASLIAR